MMTPINWDTIKYFFQIPLDWFRTIHRKVCHAYGVNFVRVRQDGEDGGLEIGVDEKMLADFIQDVAGTPEPGEGTVLSVDNVGPGPDGNVTLGAVRSVNGTYFPDPGGNVVIPTGGTVTSVDNVAPVDGNVNLYALTVDDLGDAGITAGLSYRGDYTVTPMSHGHLASDIVNGPLAMSVDSVYKPDSNGNIDLKAVRTEGNQAIGGYKTFTSSLRVGPVGDETRAYYSQGRVELFGGTPHVDFHTGSSTADYTDRIIAGTANFEVKTTGGKNLVLNADAGNVQLQNHPPASTSTATLAVPTVGWCNSYLGRIKTVNNKQPDANGNVMIETGNGTVKSVDGVSPNSNGNVVLSAVVTTDVETAGIEVSKNGSYERFACPTAHGHSADDVSIGNTNLYGWVTGAYSSRYDSYMDMLRGFGFVRNLEINGQQVTFGDDGVDRFEFALTADKWLKSDANGRVVATNETPISLPSGTTGKNVTKTVLTGLSWNGTQLVATRETWTYTKGVLTNVASASNVTINTVAYS